MNKLPYLLPLLLLLLCSCKTKDNLTYFRNNTPTPEQVISRSEWQIKIEPGDELSIIVSSEVATNTEMFNLPPAAGANTSKVDKTGGIITYRVDKTGDINMPKLGKIHVAGLTTGQIAEQVTRMVAEYVEAPLVIVSLENFKVNVIGEVAKPQVIKVPGERFTILEAIAEAGDLTVFGRRDNVTLIREENGEVTYHRLDLSDADLIKSPYYYLQQNDVVYVEPNGARKDQSEYSVNDSYKIQVVSTIVSGVSVLVSLIIALTVK